MIPGTLATYQINYTNVLTEVRSLEPSANLFLLGYYNPCPADPTANPAKPIFAGGGPELNKIIQDLATEFHANYVDTNSAFLGKAGALTYIAQYPSGSTSPAPGSGIEPIGDVHPNDAGYTVIANQVASTPEPASMDLVATAAAGFGLAWCLRCRQALVIAHKRSELFPASCTVLLPRSFASPDATIRGGKNDESDQEAWK